MDGTRARRTRDRIRQTKYARSPQLYRFPSDEGGTKNLLPAGAATRPALNREARILLRDQGNSIRGFAELLAEDPSLTRRSRRFAINIIISLNQLIIDLDREPSDGPSDRGE